jgi:nitrite reductase/ring-hydroxylating ferredoxin subunit
MDRAPSRPSADTPAFDPRVTPLPRRSVLKLAGATIVSSSALAAVLAGCEPPPPVTVALDLDVAALPVGTPTLVEFTATLGTTTVDASAWLVKRADGELIAYDPRCTHALCIYRWDDAADRFNCACHDGRFALDGAVLAGPPPRPLDRWPVRETATGIELDVPGNFVTPRESLG